jgi:pyridoxal phosphate enzyme (YggS family)
MTELNNRLRTILDHINLAEQQAEIMPNSVQLLAVSKTQPTEVVRQTAELGQRYFGENYLQEALIKINSLKDLQLEWHFIGPIQSNKTKDIAENFDWVQTVDRLKIAQRLDNQRPSNRGKLNICIQVNIDNESTKSGIAATALFKLAEQISQLNNLLMRGLMIIPTHTDDPRQQQRSFQQAQLLFKQLAEIYPSVDTLSMGMSGDMTMAIAEGSTMVRIGTALFGMRHASDLHHSSDNK